VIPRSELLEQLPFMQLSEWPDVTPPFHTFVRCERSDTIKTVVEQARTTNPMVAVAASNSPGLGMVSKLYRALIRGGQFVDVVLRQADIQSTPSKEIRRLFPRARVVYVSPRSTIPSHSMISAIKRRVTLAGKKPVFMFPYCAVNELVRISHPEEPTFVLLCNIWNLKENSDKPIAISERNARLMIRKYGTSVIATWNDSTNRLVGSWN